jgi:hypothetical protein
MVSEEFKEKVDAIDTHQECIALVHEIASGRREIAEGENVFSRFFEATDSEREVMSEQMEYIENRKIELLKKQRRLNVEQRGREIGN